MTAGPGGSGARRSGLLPWGGVWRQSRRDAAALVVGMVVVAAAAFLSSAVPQALDVVATSAVRQAVAEPTQPVEVVVTVPIDRRDQVSAGAAAATDTVRGLVDAGMPAELRSVLAEPVTALVGPELKAGVIAGRPGRVRFSYVASAAGPAVAWVEGRSPAATGDLAADPSALPVEVALSEEAAQLLGVHPGARLRVDNPDGGQLDVRLSGVYRATQPGDDVWTVAPTLLEPQLIDGSAALASVGLLLSADSLPFAMAVVSPGAMTRTFTYPVLASRLDAELAAQVATQARSLASGRKVFEIGGTTQPTVTTGLDRVIDDMLARVAAATAQASVLLLGVLAVALLVEFLAAGLVVERRAVVLAQWRSRGATLPAIALAQAAESTILTATAGAIGLAAAGAVAGGVPPLGWVLPPLLVALVPGPLLALRAAAGANRTPAGAPAGRRARLTAAQLRRLAAEGVLVVLAAGALATLTIRGATASAASVWSDAVVLAAPVLVALAVGLGLVRVQPRLSAVARPVAARRVGAVPLLAAARIRGSGPAIAGLVVAAAVVAIAASAAQTVSQGRVAAAWDVVGADAAVSTTRPGGLPVGVAGLDATDGLTVATAQVVPRAQLVGSGLDRSVTVVAVDSDALGRLLAATPAPDAPVLARLAGAAETDGVLPVLTMALPGWEVATLRWGDDAVPVHPVGDAPELPQQVAPGENGAVLVDRQALARALGHDVPASLGWAVGPDAEARLAAALGGADPRVVTRDGWLAAQASSPLPRALGWLFAGASVVAAGLAALAVVLMAASGASERSVAAAQLRVVGTPRATAARVTWLESAVPAVVASAVGLAVGAGLSALLVGALDLRSVTGGRQLPPLVLAGWTLILPLALGLVARIAAAFAAVRGRREPLGSLMRAG